MLPSRALPISRTELVYLSTVDKPTRYLEGPLTDYTALLLYRAQKERWRTPQLMTIAGTFAQIDKMDIIPPKQRFQPINHDGLFTATFVIGEGSAYGQVRELPKEMNVLEIINTLSNNDEYGPWVAITAPLPSKKQKEILNRHRRALSVIHLPPEFPTPAHKARAFPTKLKYRGVHNSYQMIPHDLACKEHRNRRYVVNMLEWWPPEQEDNLPLLRILKQGCYVDRANLFRPG